VTAKKEDDTPIYTQTGTFTTTGAATSIDEIVNRKSSNRKLIIGGHLYILHNGKMYTIHGAVVK